MDNQSKFRTLIIIDLETTGLIDDEPKITELAMIAVNMLVSVFRTFFFFKQKKD